MPHITQAEIDEVVDTFRSGWLTTGPKTKRFERDLLNKLALLTHLLLTLLQRQCILHLTQSDCNLVMR